MAKYKTKVSIPENPVRLNRYTFPETGEVVEARSYAESLKKRKEVKPVKKEKEKKEGEKPASDIIVPSKEEQVVKE